jgi:hypothetical protein
MSNILEVLRPRNEVLAPIFIHGFHTAIIFAVGRWIFSFADDSLTTSTWINFSEFYGDGWFDDRFYSSLITCALHIAVCAHLYYTYSDDWALHIALRFPLSILAGLGIAILAAIVVIISVFVTCGLGYLIILLLVVIGSFLTIGWEYLARCTFHLVTDSPIAAWWLLGGLIGGIAGSYVGFSRVYSYRTASQTKRWTAVWIPTLCFVFAMGILFWSK